MWRFSCCGNLLSAILLLRMRTELGNQDDRLKTRTTSGEAIHETVWGLFECSLGTRLTGLAVGGAGLGVQGPPDRGLDRGETFDAGSETICREIAGGESHRSEIEPLLRWGQPRSDGRCIDGGG